jgi:hypothetical protein
MNPGTNYSLLFLKTDQNSCYNPDGKEISCNGSGQDAENSSPLAAAKSRFKKLADNLIDDSLTGLVWPQNANLAEFPLTWPEALNFINNMNSSKKFGFNDWRLPNRRELRGLMSHQTRKPSLPAGHPFENIFLGWYWTATTAAINPQYAWYVHMEGARMFYGRKDQYYLVWPVRGDASSTLPQTGQTKCYDLHGLEIDCNNSGQDGEIKSGFPWPEPRFIIKTHYVYDQLTHLYWLTNANFYNGLVNWAEALALVDSLNKSELGKIGKWRLPNINELESLTDCSEHNPALPRNHPFINVQEAYWSSTTSFFETDWAWVLYLHKGALGVGFKKGRTFSVWPVCSAN